MRAKSKRSSSERPHSQVGLLQKEYESITQFQIIRRASHLLYDALKRACAAHSEHFATLCLAPSCMDSALDVGPHHIRFTMAITPFYEPFETIASLGANQSPEEIRMVSQNVRESYAEVNISSGQVESSRSSPSPLADNMTWLEIESIIRDKNLSGQQPQHTTAKVSQLPMSESSIKRWILYSN
jgi:hypothetical protein